MQFEIGFLVGLFVLVVFFLGFAWHIMKVNASTKKIHFCKIGDEIVRSMSGDSIRCFFAPTDELPKSGDKISFWLKTGKTLEATMLREWIGTVDYCSTISSLGGNMKEPEMKLVRTPEVRIYVREEIPARFV